MTFLESSESQGLDNIPAKLTEGEFFVLWKIVQRNGKPGKVPFRTDGRKARVNDPADWSTFDEARRVLETSDGGYSGIGRVVTGGDFACIDLDHVIDGGELWPQAREILDALSGAYVERSPGGSGLHVWARGRFVRTLKKKFSFPAGRAVEFYDGFSSRFMTLTGDVWDGHGDLSADDVSDVLSGVYVRIFQSCGGNRNVKSSLARGSDDKVIDGNGSRQGPELSDGEVLRLAKVSKGGDVFKKLYDTGDWAGAGFPSCSEGRLSLLARLAFYSRKNAAQIAHIYRASTLYQDNADKCGRLEQFEIQRAVETCKDTYRGAVRPKLDTNISSRRWREISRSLDADSRIVLLELLLGLIREITSTGIVILPRLAELLSLETGLTTRRTRKALNTLKNAGYIYLTTNFQLLGR
jgi:primase-polymerase (primpol)-like protein